MPALNEALAALDLIEKGDIAKIKQYSTPPPLVRYTLEMVSLLLGEKTDWDAIKRTLSNMNFINRLREYKKDEISKLTLNKLRKGIN
jgi:dynein heavy chain